MMPVLNFSRRSACGVSPPARRLPWQRAGTIFGMANTLSSFGGWLSTFMVGELTKEHNTADQWMIVFYILSATYILGALCFVCFGSGERQPWSSPPVAPKQEEEPLHEEKA
ncbi:hypothetical protein evm_005468 [Chilo suppressalis]|nr:hypothetical protein evm_005468 [Chilo suppressalis]